MNEDRRRQVKTTLERHGANYYKEIGAKSKGGGFNDPEVARKAALKMHENRRKKLKEQRSGNS